MTESSTDGGSGAGLGPDGIRQVLEALEASAWDEAVVVVGDVRIAVARNGASLPSADPGAAVAPAAATAAAPVAAPTPAATSSPVPPTPRAPEPEETSGLPVTSPSVGVFWRAPEPGAAPFAEVGEHVGAGQTLCIVEVMKLMSHVDAPVAGTVSAIHVENSTSVEHGQVLFTLVPDEG